MAVLSLWCCGYIYCSDTPLFSASLGSYRSHSAIEWFSVEITTRDLSFMLLFVYLTDTFIQGDLQRLGCVNYASAAESLTITSHPKDGAQGG